MFGTLLITGALILVPMLNRNEDPNSIVQETELRQEEKAPLDIGSDIPRFKLDRDSDSGAAAETPPPVIGDSRSPKPALPKDSGNTARESVRQKLATGISKGGQATMFYRSYFPDDVDISVPYVAPQHQGG